MQKKSAQLTRRGMIGAGAGIIGTIGLADPAHAATGAGGPVNPRGLAAGIVDTGVTSATLPTLAFGEQALWYGPEGGLMAVGFDSTPVAAQYMGGAPSGVRPTSGLYLAAEARLPVGATLTAVDTAFYNDSVAPSGKVTVLRYLPGDLGFDGPLADGTLAPSGAGTSILTLPGLSETFDGSQVITAEIQLTADDTWVRGVRFRYRPAGGLFVPIPPKRVYDSRYNMTPDAYGKLTGGHNRTVSVANGRAANGTVDTADVIPPGATAIAYNVTLTGTTGGSFLAVNTGGDTVLKSSSLNWTASGQTLANAAVVKIGAARTVTVICGPGTRNSTHFILDALGYYLP